jgi:hypothetical protein
LKSSNAKIQYIVPHKTLLSLETGVQMYVGEFVWFHQVKVNEGCVRVNGWVVNGIWGWLLLGFEFFPGHESKFC